jgi:hypothetical protein
VDLTGSNCGVLAIYQGLLSVPALLHALYQLHALAAVRLDNNDDLSLPAVW